MLHSLLAYMQLKETSPTVIIYYLPFYVGVFKLMKTYICIISIFIFIELFDSGLC